MSKFRFVHPTRQMRANQARRIIETPTLLDDIARDLRRTHILFSQLQRVRAPWRSMNLMSLCANEDARNGILCLEDLRENELRKVKARFRSLAAAPCPEGHVRAAAQQLKDVTMSFRTPPRTFIRRPKNKPPSVGRHGCGRGAEARQACLIARPLIPAVFREGRAVRRLEAAFAKK